ncbi:hypothetical protein [Vibrio sp. D431a]|uniref:hypothetical protein n=1 Tax=Vibrio sp. D431a TaxID=2837388 RepID=UPI0025548E97|nr:hypothetical protein [Vibrio sp. D431a]MDK9790700.1 hypothetical protein [Vibrio sp. D431a]
MSRRSELLSLHQKCVDKTVWWAHFAPSFYINALKLKINNLQAKIEEEGYESLYNEIQEAVSVRRMVAMKIRDKDSLIALYGLLKDTYGKEGFRDSWDEDEKQQGHYRFLDFFDLFNAVFKLANHEHSYMDVEEAIKAHRAG